MGRRSPQQRKFTLLLWDARCPNRMFACQGFRTPAECSSDVPPPSDPAPGDGDDDGDDDDDDWPWLSWVIQEATAYSLSWPF